MSLLLCLNALYTTMRWLPPQARKGAARREARAADQGAGEDRGAAREAGAWLWIPS